MRVNPRLIIKTLKKNGLKVYKTAFELGVHPTTVYRWKVKARTAYGISSFHLQRKSTRPHKIKRYNFPLDQINNILKLRQDTGYDAHKIVVELNLSASPKTVHRFLVKHGVVRKYGYHIRPRFQNTLHMHAKNTTTIGYLQMDVKYITPELSGLVYTCFEYAVIDIFSRYKQAVILNHLDQDGAIAALLEILPKLPFKPVFLQTDNGLEFQGRFQKLLSDLSLKHHMIHKSTPNENALIERSFRTDEEEFFFRLDRAPENYDQLRVWFASWLERYNNRPHFGIQLKTPNQIVANVLSY